MKLTELRVSERKIKGVAIRDMHRVADMVPRPSEISRSDLHIVYLHRPMDHRHCGVSLYQKPSRSTFLVRAQDAAKSKELLDCLSEEDRNAVLDLAEVCIENRLECAPKVLFNTLYEASEEADKLTEHHSISMWGEKWGINTSIYSS